MESTRPYALIRTKDQWLRAAHWRTAIDDAEGFVELGWVSDSESRSGTKPSSPAGGLAFDSWCRLYRSIPSQGRVERWIWAARDPLAPVGQAPAPADLFEVPAEPWGDSSANEEVTAALRNPRGLAFDEQNRLFVAESGANRILVFDLSSRRLVRSINLALPNAAASPVDLAAHGRHVYALTQNPYRLFSLTAYGRAESVPLPKGSASATRVAASGSGRIALLDPGAGGVWLVGEKRSFFDLSPFGHDVKHLTDVEFESDDLLVAAFWPGEDFVRVSLGDEAVARPGLRARGYDGRGIVRAPDGRIGFWSNHGFRSAVAARLSYEKTGTVTSFRLDSGEWQTVWGRLFLDACIPAGTEVRVFCAAADEPPDEETIERTPPVNGGALKVDFPELSAPMPPVSLQPDPDDDRFTFQPIHRRETGRELPWAQPRAGDRFVTFEAPIQSDAGRYLWVTLKLIGNTRLTPRVKCLRAEHPSHDYLRRLPKAFSRETLVSSFLRRYLAIFEGFLGEADARAVERQALLNPRAAPDEVLPWLASFVGLVLDERWSQAPSRRGSGPRDARRQLIEEAICLFRFRGTVGGLRRLLEIYAGVPVAVIEHFRLRGLGGAFLGDARAGFSSSVLGSGFRVGGAVGLEGEVPMQGGVEDAFRTHAHRFSVILPAALDGEQLAAVRDAVEAHRPAHTIFDVCTVAAGMRVGSGLHVGLTSVIGQGGGFESLRLGSFALGREAILGRPEDGVVLGDTRLGDNSRVV